MPTDPVRVFISYSHDSPEHIDRVLALADRLRTHGVDAEIDQYEPAPARGWPRWMEDRIEWAERILVVVTETYHRRFRGREETGRGLGGTWEGAILTQELYEGAGENRTIIPVVLDRQDAKHIPRILRGVVFYDLSQEGGYDRLYRRLTDQPEVTRTPLGKRRKMPLRPRRTTFLAAASPTAEPEQLDRRAEIDQIERAEADLERMRGILPEQQLAASLAALAERRRQLEAPSSGSATAQVDGDGAIAQGPGAVAAGAGGAAVAGSVGGNVIVANRIDRVDAGPSTDDTKMADAADLRRAYLRRVLRQCGYVTLGGVDPALGAAERDTRLELHAIYTALLTESRESETGERGKAGASPELPREPRQLSALELLDREPHLVLLGEPGSGKSTFLDFVALCLAGEGLGSDNVNLERLTAPLPTGQEEVRFGEPSEPIAQPWRHGPLLPLRLVLRDFAARGLPEPGRRGTAKQFWKFVEGELESADLGPFAPKLREELRSKGGLLLLDGLDEVPRAEERRAQLCEALADVVDGLSDECRVLVTCRTYAYRETEEAESNHDEKSWRLPGFAEAVLAPFSKPQIARFVDGWYRHLAKLRDIEDAAGRARALKDAIFGRERLLELAQRPLLLALVSSLHAWRRGSLPDKRERLYADTVDLLLDAWERQRLTYDEEGKPITLEPSLAVWLEVDQEKVRDLLEELAFNAHARQRDDTGTADVPEAELSLGLMAIARSERANPVDLAEYLSHRAGVVVPRGTGVFTFPHRTFQEYLAACHLTDHDFPDRVAELARAEPGRWREVALLAGAKAARGSASTVWQLAEALCWREPDAEEREEADEWGALLAGQVLVESADLGRVSERNAAKLDRIRRWQVALLASELPPVERAAAGVSLAELGDARFSREHWSLPDEPLLGFVEVPAGRFLMGSDKKKDPEAYADEMPQHELELPAFFMARWPVTVAQFRAFVEASGFSPGTKDWTNGVENGPVVWVSWHEARAYCKWLEGRLRELAPVRLVEAQDEVERRFWGGVAAGEFGVRLPSEAEWEKAARGTDGRIFPWGPKADPDRASYSETGLSAPSTVGCFLRGASPYGCEEMAGNVWEWTRSLWGEDVMEPSFRYPFAPADGREDAEASDSVLRVLRGGSFITLRRLARCSYRYRASPGYRRWRYGFRVLLSPFPLTSERSGL